MKERELTSVKFGSMNTYNSFSDAINQGLERSIKRHADDLPENEQMSKQTSSTSYFLAFSL